MSLRGWEPAEWMDSQSGIKGDEELMDKRKKKTTWKKERGFFKEGALIFFSPTMTMMEKYLNW